MAAQDFRHATQDENEKVSDFIRHLEKTFCRAYGHDTMLSETRDALLYAQLQEGLRYDLMKAPAVSGALNFQALGVAAKSKERRLDKLQKRKRYQSPQLQGTKLTSLKFLLLVANSSRNRATTEVPNPVSPNRDRVLAAVLTQGQGSAGIVRKSDIWHTIAPSRRKRALADQTTNQVSTKMVSSIEIEILKEIMDDPLQYLLSDSDNLSYVRHVRIQDQGSKPQKAKVVVGGVPMSGSN